MRSALLRSTFAACLLLVLPAATVLGHAVLVESDPADGDTIQTPYKLTATFAEEFDPNPQRSFITVVDATGAEVASGAVSEDDPTVMTADVPALEPGVYTVRWQTTTSDDNGVERGTFTFTVAAPAPSASPTSALPTLARPVPTGSGGGGEGQTTGGNDVLLAIVIAAVAIGAIAIFVFARVRR
jgi:methionine-rich copper-binding protein CopC